MKEVLAINGLVLKQNLNTGPEILVNELHLQLRTYRPLTLIGESGCGKSLVGHALIGLIPKGVTAEGAIMFKGMNLLSNAKHTRRLWGRELFLFPQEPGRYLNPLVRSLPQVTEVYRQIHKNIKGVAQQRGRRMMRSVDLQPEDERKYPWQLSGGMGQRLLTAVSMAQPARVIVADEPTKGLDRETKYKTVSLLKTMSDSGKALLVITHDLEVPKHLGGDLAVMYAGQILEMGPAEEILAKPQHPYTSALREAQPKNGLKPIPRRVNGYQGHGGCVFSRRCHLASTRCFRHCPHLQPTGIIGHMIACHACSDETCFRFAK